MGDGIRRVAIIFFWLILASTFLALDAPRASAQGLGVNDSIVYNTSAHAKAACEAAVHPYSNCGNWYGGLWTYYACWGPWWRYCNAPKYVWCPWPQVVIPHEGIRLKWDDPSPCGPAKPDYKILSLNAPNDSPAPGDTIDLSGQIEDDGELAGSARVGIYLVPSGGTIDLNNPLALSQVYDLPLRQTVDYDLKVQLPSDLGPGDYTIEAIVNIDGYKTHQAGGAPDDEYSYDNNILSTDITVQGGPDLTASLTPTTNLSSVEAGQLVKVDVTIKNAGQTAMSKTTDAAIYLSDDNKLDSSDKLLKGGLSVPALDKNHTFEVRAQFNLPKSKKSGSYQLIAVANADDVFAHDSGATISPPVETDFTNNTAVAELDVPKEKGDVNTCQTSVGDPINTASSHKFENEVDYQGTGPFPLRFARIYNSHAGNTQGWNTSYSQHLFINSNADGTTDVIYVRDDSMRYEFLDVDHKGYGDPDVPGFMTRTAGGFSYLDADDTIHEFDSAGRLTSLISRTGFTQTMAYSGGQLTTVTDQFGRSLHLSYNADGRLSAMQTPDGQVYRYAYNANGLLSKVTLPDNTPADNTDNPTRQYLYESPNLTQGLTGVIDENGNRYSTFDYDTQGRAILSKHFNNVDTTTISYGDEQATVTNALGKQTVYEFQKIQGVNRLVRVDGLASTNCPMTSSTRTYDSRGSVVQSVDKNGNITRYTYTHTGQPDGQYLSHEGLVTSRTEAAGTPEQRTTTIQWHPKYRLPIKITEPNRTTEMMYDDHARLVERKVTATDTGATRIWHYTYNAQGLLASTDGPRTDVNDVTQFTWTDKGDLASVTDALGHTTQILDHDPSGLPLTTEDPNGLITHLSYDARRRLVSTTVDSNAGSATTGIDYDAKGNVIAIHLPDGQTLHYSYDMADRLTSITNDLGESITYTLDNDGNRTAAVTRGSNQTIVRVQRSAFDELGRLIKTIGAANQTRQVGYDLNGNLDLIQDAMGNSTHMGFDGLNRLISTTDALNGESSFTYDGQDNLTSVTDADGVKTSYHYDGLGNLLEEDSTASGTTHYTYDAAGNRITKLDANGVEADYQYDALNRLTAVNYPSASQEDIAYHYDEGANGIDHLMRVDDPSGETRFSYDQRGNLITDARTINGVHYETDYAWNLGGHLTRMVYPSGRIISYQLDQLGRIVAISTQATGASPVQTVANDLSYLPFGPADHWVDGNGVATDISYDKDYRITDIDAHGTNDILSLGYTYNDNSNITAMADRLGPDSQQFGYDALNRLTSAAGQYGDIDYRYDGVGDRTQRTITNNGATGQEDSTYQTGSHRLQSVTTTDGSGTSQRTFQYDANGNTIADVSPERALALAFNARNRLAEIDKDGTPVGMYQYNALGQRVAKTSTYVGRIHATLDQGNTAAASNGKANGKGNANAASQSNLHVTTDNTLVTEHLQFVYDAQGNLIAENDDQGNVIREYIYLGNFRIAMTNASLNHPQVTPSQGPVGPLVLYFIHSDHLGTPRDVTDESQNIVWAMHQTPFGEATLDTEAIRMPMRFPGQYADIESGLNYNYFRDYDPSLGRYVESDPIDLNGGVNSYGYVLQNPGYHDDPRGLNAISWGLRGLGAIGLSIPGAEPVGVALLVLSLSGDTPQDDTKKQCDGKNNDCPPCRLIDGTTVPVGTIAYRPLESPDTPQHGVEGPHYNIYKANQNPKNCQCFWQRQGAVGPSQLPPGAIPIQPFAN